MKLTKWLVVMVLSVSVACTGGKNIPGGDNDDRVPSGFPFSDERIYHGSFIIRNQEDVDFIRLYEIIAGDLGVQAPELESFRLPNLTTIEGRLLIFENNALLKNFQLPELTTVGGTLSVWNNPSLVDLNGLASVKSVGENLHITHNPSLVSIDGLGQLKFIGGYFSILGNHALGGIQSLNQLVEIGGDLNIFNNDAMTKIEGWENLTTIGGGLSIFTMDRLLSVSGMNSLSTIVDSLMITLNSSLNAIDGFEQLEAIGGGLTVADNPQLSTCVALALRDLIGEASVVGEITISGNLGECDGSSPDPEADRPVGSACDQDEQCAGPGEPVCLREYKPVVELMFPDTDPDLAAQYENIGLDFPGGYCSTDGKCAEDSECGAGGTCFMPFEEVAPETLDDLAEMGFPFDIYGFSDLGVCLDACVDTTECREGYTCGIPIGDLLALVPDASQGTYCIAPPATGVCLDNPCLNGGICVNDTGDNFLCDCPPGFGGVNCETILEGETELPDLPEDETPCQSNPCQNGGVCTEVGESYECACASGFVGDECEALIDCGTPPHVSNADLLVATTTYGSQAHYDCAVGYVTSGDESEGLVCEADGEWSGELPTCSVVSCDAPPAVTDGSLSYSETTYHSLAIYQCDEGRLMSPVDGAVRYCDEDGGWSGVTPTCTMIDCGAPASLENGSSTSGTTTYGSQVSYQCDVGYSILPVNGATQACSSDAQWHGPTPVCTAVNCGTPAAASNGSVDYTTTGYNDTVLYDCNAGYAMEVGDTGERVCQSNGYWSGGASVCTVLGDCNPGYSRVDGSCVDIDECAQGGSNCDSLVTCTNTEGAFVCGACPTGYTDVFGNGTQCLDVDECAQGLDDCSGAVQCTNTAGSYSCGGCPGGYTDVHGDGTLCEDIDECSGAIDNCDSLVVCTNTQGGFDCGACPSGYDDVNSDGTLCEDSNECISGLNDCDSVATCTNQVGSFECTCPDEWTDAIGDGSICEEPVVGCSYHILTYELTGVFRIAGTTFGLGDGSYTVPNANDPSHKGTLKLRVSDDGDGNPGDGAAGVLYYSMDQIFSTSTSGLSTNTDTNGVVGIESNTTAINAGSISGTGLTWDSCNTSGSGNNWTPDNAASGPGCLPNYHSTGNVECIDNSAFANCSTGGLQDGDNPQDEYWTQPFSNFSFGTDLSSVQMGESPLPNRSPSTTYIQFSGNLLGSPTCIQE